MAKKMILAIVVLVAALAIPTASEAAYTKVLPGGLTNKASTAKKRINSLMSYDAGVQTAVANNHGLSPEELEDARVLSVSRSKVTIGRGVDNSARNASTGAVVPTSYMSGQTVASWTVVLRLRDGRTVVDSWKRDCSNPFLKKNGGTPPLRPTVRVKYLTIRYNKTQTESRQFVCASAGQAITVTVTARVKGSVRVKVYSKAVAMIKQKISAKVKLDFTAQIKADCGTPPPHDACVNLEGNQNSIPNGMILVAGNCVNQSNTAEQDCQIMGGTFNGATQLCTIIQINGNCSNITVVNGSGNVVNVTQEGNCNVQPPPPPCPDGRPEPPEGCDRPPFGEVVASAAHMQTGNRRVELYFEGGDPDGDIVTLDNLLTAPIGTYVSGKRPVGWRYDLTPCPPQITCWQATMWSGDTPGYAYVSGVFTAGGESFTTAPVTVQVENSQFPAN